MRAANAYLGRPRSSQCSVTVPSSPAGWPTPPSPSARCSTSSDERSTTGTAWPPGASPPTSSSAAPRSGGDFDRWRAGARPEASEGATADQPWSVRASRCPVRVERSLAEQGHHHSAPPPGRGGRRFGKPRSRSCRPPGDHGSAATGGNATEGVVASWPGWDTCDHDARPRPPGDPRRHPSQLQPRRGHRLGRRRQRMRHRPAHPGAAPGPVRRDLAGLDLVGELLAERAETAAMEDSGA